MMPARLPPAVLGALGPMLLAFAAAATAQQDIVTIEDPELNARYQEMIQEVRCLVCENRSIAESPSDVAQDLKKVIRDMILDGASKDEIAAFLAARYGDSILYRPPLQPNTWLLWSAPALLLVIGGIVFARIVRTRMNAPIDDDDDEFAADGAEEVGARRDDAGQRA